MNISMHSRVPHFSYLTVDNRYTYGNSGSVTVLDIIRDYLPLMNAALRQTVGVEVDLMIAGSCGLRSVLRSNSRYQQGYREQAITMPVGDMDIFIGIRKINVPTAISDSNTIASVVSTDAFNNLLHVVGGGTLRCTYRGGSSTITSEGSEGAAGLHTCYRLTPMSLNPQQTQRRLPNMNIILREDIVGDNLSSNLEGLFNSFDLDILETASIITNTNGNLAREMTAWTSDFNEAIKDKTARAKGEMGTERQSKYTWYCNHLGITADWMMS